MNSAYLTVPQCYPTGFTGETNNLYLDPPPNSPTPGALPALVFAEGSPPGVPNLCMATTVVGPRNGLVVWPVPSVGFAGPQGGPFQKPLSLTLSAVSGSVSYSISGLPSWMAASPTSGMVTTSGQKITLTMTAAANSLAQGQYPATFNIDNTTNGIGSLIGDATLRVEAPTPQPIISPTGDLGFSGPFGGPFAPPALTYTLQASSGTLNYSLADIPAWLKPSSMSGTPTTQPSTLTLTLNTAIANGYPKGKYPVTIYFYSSYGGNYSRIVTLTVN
jgi:hypothetical protein